MRGTATALLRASYGCYAWAVLLLDALALALVLALTPGLQRRRRAARRSARLFFRLSGSAIRVSGTRPPDAPCVVVANHGSYLDGLILTAALPPRFTFVIKQEMAHVPLAGFLLRRLGSKFVDRADARRRNVAVRDLVDSAVQGDALALFPEGTFDATPGLKPFQAGAFAAAWRAGLPVLPVVIRGARDKLPSGAALPAPGPVEVRVCEPLAAERYASWRALMQAARDAMLEHLGEPDLAGDAAAGTERPDDAGEPAEPLTSRRNQDRSPPPAEPT